MINSIKYMAASEQRISMFKFWIRYSWYRRDLAKELIEADLISKEIK